MNFITLKYLIISVKKGKPRGYVRPSIAQHHKITITTTHTNIVAIHIHHFIVRCRHCYIQCHCETLEADLP